MTPTTVKYLLARGDTVSLDKGRLIINPISGRNVPLDWLHEHAPDFLREILEALGMDGFFYESYSTGHYSKSRYPGITLRFPGIVRCAGQVATCFTITAFRSLKVKHCPCMSTYGSTFGFRGTFRGTRWDLKWRNPEN